MTTELLSPEIDHDLQKDEENDDQVGLLFKDQYGTAYALVHFSDHDEIARVESNTYLNTSEKWKNMD